MEGIIKAIEIFAFVSGLVYIILEIGQKNLMWVLGIFTGVACAFSFAVQHLYSSMALNIYYVIVSVIGLYKWRKASEAISESARDEGKTIHLAKISTKSILISLGVFILGTIAIVPILNGLGDNRPILDAVVTMMSIVATWWLAKSYPEQWLLWIVADLLSTILCAISGMYWMSLLYAAYALSSFYGLYVWKKKGVYVD